MASRVNTRFVLILAMVLALAGGGVVTLAYFMGLGRHTSEQLAALGDKQMAAGNYEEATKLYAKAVNKDQQNPRVLRLWIGALEKLTPVQKQTYQDKYYREYLPALRGLAEVLRTDAPAHRRFLDEVYTRHSRMGGSDVSELELIIKEVDTALKNFADNPAGAKSLRRYRGLARLGILTSGAQLDPEHIEQARADFKAALEADPEDAESAACLSDLDRILAAKARKERDDAASDRLIASARASITEYLDKHPTAGMALLQLLRLEVSETGRRAQAERKSVNPMVENVDLVKRLVEAVRATEPASIDLSVAGGAAAYALRTPSLEFDAALAVVDRALEGRPQDSVLLTLRAEVQQQSGKFNEAIETLQQVVNLKDKPISLDGLILWELRGRAAARQVDCVLAQWKATAKAEERKAVIDRAKTMRGALANLVGEQNPSVKLVDARIKYQEGNIAGARIAMTSIIEREGSRDKLAHAFLGEILRRTGENGEARRCFERVVELDPGNVQAHLILATLAVEAMNVALAEQHLAAANQLDPGNTQIETQLNALREFQKGASTTDPVLQIIQKASALLAEPNLPEALKVAREGLANHPDELRLIALLVQLLMASKDREGAQAVVEGALVKRPDDATLKDIQRQLKYASPMEAQLAMIDAWDASALQKHISRSILYTQAGKPEQAGEELEAARAIEPDDKSVLELSFVRAVGAGKLDEAKAIGERGGASNADNLNGLSYRGRLAMAEGRFQDAVAAFTQASEIDRFNSLVWRFLGDSRFMLKQFDEAMAAYDRALETRPNDLSCVKGSVRAAYAAGRVDQALDTARKAWRSAVGVSDADFVNLLLLLEANAGAGDKRWALQGRMQIAKRKPEDRENKLQLVELQITLKQFEEARRLLDELRASGLRPDAPPSGLRPEPPSSGLRPEPPDDIGSVIDLDARWHAVKGDLAGAKKVYEDYIATLGEKHSDEPYARLSILLAYMGKDDEAIAALKEGQRFQDPAFLGTDRQLAFLYLRAGKYQEALDTIRHILEVVKTDPNNALMKGVIECQLQLGRAAEAEAAIASLGDAGLKDQTIMLLKARAALLRKDLAGARRIFDQAVAANPTAPLGYYQRADFILEHEKDRRADAEADLANAIRLDPRFVAARRRLYNVLFTTGRPDQALQQLRDTLGVDPDNDEVRAMLVNVLMTREQPKAAADVIAEVMKRKPDSVMWAVQAAEVFIKAGTPDEALPFLKRAWEIDKSGPVALAYAEVIIKARDPNLATARDVVSDTSLEPDKNFQLLMKRAQIYKLAKQDRECDSDIMAAYKLMDCTDPTSATAFFNGLNAIFPNFIDHVRILDKLTAQTEFKDWCLLNDLSIRAIDRNARPQLWERMQAQADREDNKDISYAANSLIANLRGEGRDFEDAARHFKRCVELRPDNAEALNNYAYIIGEELHRPAEALPFAEKAAELAPLNVGILDTLGTMQLRTNQPEKADATFQRANNNATNNDDRAPVYLHVAELRLLQGNRPEARRNAELLEAIFKLKPGLRTPYGPGLEELQKKLDAP